MIGGNFHSGENPLCTALFRTAKDPQQVLLLLKTSQKGFVMQCHINMDTNAIRHLHYQERCLTFAVDQKVALEGGNPTVECAMCKDVSIKENIPHPFYLLRN